MEQGRLDLGPVGAVRSGRRDQTTRRFFASKKAPAILKHGLIKRHMSAFAAKLGGKSLTGQVALLDTHAGAGYYADGSLGSPAIAVKTAYALAGLPNPRRVRCLLVEKDAELHRQLETRFGSNPHVWIAPRGSIEKHFETVLAEVGNDPLFAFLDPYGFPPPYTMVKQLLQRSDHLNGRDLGPPTEILINFSVQAVRRTAALLDSTKPNPAQKAQMRRLTDMMGGSYWETLCRDSPEAERVNTLLRSYMRDLQHVGGGWQVFAVPVAYATHLEPVYYLVFCTRSDHGVLSFSEACSLAVREYYAAINGVAPEQVELNTFGMKEWVPKIEHNIEALLRQGDVRVLHHLPEIYDDLFGLARTTHLRTAIKRLHDRHVTPSDGRGDVESMTIMSPGGAGGQKQKRSQAFHPIVSRLALAPQPSAFDLPTA